MFKNDNKNRIKILIIIFSFFIIKNAYSGNFEILKFSGSVEVSADNKNWKKLDSPTKLKD